MKNRVKEYRNRSNLTQKQLAEHVFVSQRTIISLEKGKYRPSIMLAYRLACVFETTVEDLFCLAENKKLEDQVYEDL
ncbi:transcriptional regulator [Siminovitchia terrae]|uniref:Transcriptional regulator n=1 Tax=Siminovitchia terrae TaxID=1914933 RepID=A0A429X7A5_SIMTE|nr:helix-turn-helix transcriptional regulator [Siminovitchia terrae]RST59307.1 transcriptional regulator [Siminovitchia terrae]GIN90095.1 transcriptional regulator [Siminovitchia terrae]